MKRPVLKKSLFLKPVLLFDVVKLKTFAAVSLGLALYGCRSGATLLVSNSLPYDRLGEAVELPLNDIDTRFRTGFILTDAAGHEIDYQNTSDSTLLFLADVPASSESRYCLKSGNPSPVKPKVFGRKFPEHKDNMNWENDCAAYVAYGPALQRSGERGFGYDVWTKSVDTLVIEERNRLRDLGKSLHRDHGNGMDAYIVANTLGAGTAALLNDDGSLIYPWAWREYEIVDNGPLRFKVRLTYNPAVIGDDPSVVEQRVITLDAGSELNRAEVSYEGLSRTRRIAPGIVVHRQNPYGDIAGDNVIAYADSTDNPRNGNGVIFVGVIVPDNEVDITYRAVDQPARDALGHILAVSDYAPGDTFTYYWGSSWTKRPGAPATLNEWLELLRDRARRLKNPLKIQIR